MTLDGVVVPRENLLGDPGDQLWYVLEVVAPYFLRAMAGSYLGIAEAALVTATTSIKGRLHSHAGLRLTPYRYLTASPCQV